MKLFRILRKVLMSGSGRTAVVKKNIIGSFLIKGLSILLSLLLVPLTINLLDQEKYGIWITIFSLVSWFNMMDIGIGNGFRNKFAESMALGNKKLSKEYVQVFYSSIGVIAIGFFAVFLLVNPFLNWYLILNLPSSFDENISLIILVVFGLFCLQLYLKNISTLLLSLQKTSYSNALTFLGNFTALVFILILQHLKMISLFSIAISFMLAPVIVFLVASVITFYGKLKEYRPKVFSTPKKKYLSDLVGLGLKFFFIQATAVVIYGASNILITQLFGPAEVTPYNVAFRLYSSIQVIFSIIVTPFWSAFTEANAKRDFAWIRSSIKKLINVWILFSIGVFVLWIISPFVFRIWVGNEVAIPFTLSFQFALFVILNTWTSIFSYFISGIGKIRVSLFSALVQFVFTIPLAIFLAKCMDLGTSGIILAINISLLLPAILLAIQTKKITSKKAFGIWNE